MLNNSQNLYGSEWLALVFSNRNKNYGAYVLRSQSSNILLRSLMIVAPLFIMLFVGPMIYAQLHKDVPLLPDRVVKVEDYTTIHEMEKPKELPKQAEPKAQPPAIKQPAVQTKNFTANVVVVENTIQEPVTADELKDAVISSVTQAGAPGTGNVLPSTNTVGGNGTATEGTGPGEILDAATVEAYPEFPGGMDAWAKFIQRNLKYPYAAQDAGIQGKVFLSFVVERDGSITDVKVTRGIGYGCDDEAVRVIKKSPKWKAGQQNKQTVRVRYQMPINYTLSQ